MPDKVTFSTNTLLPKSRLDAWNNCVSEAFSSCVVDAEKDFLASYEMLPLSQCTLSRVQGDAAKISIFGNQARRRLSSVVIIAHDNGEAQYSLGKECFLVGTDEFVIIDMDTAFSVDIANNNKDLYKLVLPRASLIDSVPDLASLSGKKVSRHTGAGAVLNSLWSTVWSKSSDLPAGSDRLLINAAELMLQSINEDQEISPNRAWPKIVDTITKYLGDPNLSTATIARQVHLSERSVQLLFAELGATPSGYIRERRMQVAAQRVLGAKVSMSLLARDLGYLDASLFSRHFKERFGLSPLAYRKQRGK